MGYIVEVVLFCVGSDSLMRGKSLWKMELTSLEECSEEIFKGEL
jgi:hypothetical protein